MDCEMAHEWLVDLAAASVTLAQRGIGFLEQDQVFQVQGQQEEQDARLDAGQLLLCRPVTSASTSSSGSTASTVTYRGGRDVPARGPRILPGACACGRCARKRSRQSSSSSSEASECPSPCTSSLTSTSATTSSPSSSSVTWLPVREVLYEPETPEGITDTEDAVQALNNPVQAEAASASACPSPTPSFLAASHLKKTNEGRSNHSEVAIHDAVHDGVGASDEAEVVREEGHGEDDAFAPYVRDGNGVVVVRLRPRKRPATGGKAGNIKLRKTGMSKATPSPSDMDKDKEYEREMEKRVKRKSGKCNKSGKLGKRKPLKSDKSTSSKSESKTAEYDKEMSKKFGLKPCYVALETCACGNLSCLCCCISGKFTTECKELHKSNNNDSNQKTNQKTNTNTSGVDQPQLNGDEADDDEDPEYRWLSCLYLSDCDDTSCAWCLFRKFFKDEE